MNEQASEQDQFETWAIVDVMGHQRYAGKVTEQTIAGSGFIRVDVPSVQRRGFNDEPGDSIPPFSKLLSPGSIHSITPCSEEVARAAAGNIAKVPIQRYELQLPQAVGDEQEEFDY